MDRQQLMGWLQTCDEQNDNRERLFDHALMTNSSSSTRATLHLLVVYRTRFRFLTEGKPGAGCFIHTFTFWTSRGHRCRPFSPRFFRSVFIAHKVQQCHCSLRFHHVLWVTHAVALSASEFVLKTRCHEFIRVCTRGYKNSRI